MIKTITAQELSKRLESENIKVVDIRSNDEFDREHIDVAQNVPAEHINDEFCYTNDDVLVFSCMSGVRTKNCTIQLKKLHAKEVLILDGGLNSWKKAGLNTTKNEKAPLPIVRQVHTIVGFVVVLFSILAVTVNKDFAIVSGLMAAGLLFAGLTGACGLAKILMMLPYNKKK